MPQSPQSPKIVMLGESLLTPTYLLQLTNMPHSLATNTNNTAAFQPPHILLHCSNQYRTIHQQPNNLQSVSGFEYFIASIIKQRSDQNKCGRLSGERAAGTDVNWEYEVRTSGGNCDTSANDGQIRDSIRGALKTFTEQAIDHGCVRLNNCGTWKGYLQIADHRRRIQHGKCTELFNV